MKTQQTWRPVVLAAFFAASMSVAGCSQLQFRSCHVVSSEYDAAEQATRVRLRFAVLDSEGMPVNDLTEENFSVSEDGVPATSESVARAVSKLATLGITLLIDTSKSMYDASLTGQGSNAVVEVKSAVQQFVNRLQGQGPYEFVYYRFAVDVAQVSSVADIPDTYEPDRQPAGRWTSLYHAISEVTRKHPENIIVLFSDGADNFSQNHGGVTLRAVEKLIDKGGTVIYSIGSGNVTREFDRQGISGLDALESLSTNGAVRLATQEDTLDSLFLDIERHITAIYTCDYYSPNLAGEHTLQIGVTSGERRGHSRILSFEAHNR